MHGSVFLDKNDKVIRRAILWNDQRTAAECAEMEQRVGGRAKLIKLVANPAMTGFTAPKILWLRNHEPRHFEKTRKVLLPKDEIRRRLTGEYATEVSDASGMLLLDVAQRTLVEKAALGAGTGHRPAGQVLRIGGSDRPADAPGGRELLGLTTDCVVVGGAGDCAAGAVGNGIVDRGRALSTSIGTSGVMFVHCDEVKIDPLGRVHTFCHAVRGKWHMMGVNLSAGGSLQWFRNELCKADVAAAKRAKREVYELLTEEAQAVPAGSEGLFFLPYLSGERTPHADPDARGCFIGLTLAHTRGHLIRAIMEGVTYSMRDSLEIIEGLGVPVRQIRASGGGSRSPLVAADPGRRLRPQSGHDQQRGRGGLRRGAAGGRGGRRLQEHRRGLRGHDPRGPANARQPAGQGLLRPGVPHLSAALPLAEGRFQADRGTGKTLILPCHLSLPIPVWRTLAEIALIFAVFCIEAAWPVPDVNEPYYLGKAIHFWNPDWVRGDFFLESADTHKVFYFTFGWLSLWLGPAALAWTGRSLTWLLLAWAWRRLSMAVVPRRLVLGAHRRPVRLPDGSLPHGGRMGHRRRRGQGFRLRLRLPRAGSHRPQSLEPGPAAVRRRRGVSRGGGRLGRRGRRRRLAPAC